MKYVPIFRYRDSEKSTLENVKYTKKILPLVEIIQEKRKSNMKASCFDDIKSYLSSGNMDLLIDFPMYIKFKSQTKTNVLSFLGPILANPSLRLSYFDKFIGQSIIPVVSYNPNAPLYQSGYISNEFAHLRKSFDKIALRVFLSHAQQALNEAENHLKPDDIIIVDLDESPHGDQTFTNFYSLIVSYAKKNKCKTVLVRSAIPTDLPYTKLTNNSIVKQIDNSLLKNYQKYGFDAFGDYCGTKKDELKKGGKSSPGCYFYHWWTNAYYGHKGVYEDPPTFTTIVTPSLVSSNEWKDYQSKSTFAHQKSCPGCKKIYNIATTQKKGNSASKWKFMISSHYLHTMEEFL